MTFTQEKNTNIIEKWYKLLEFPEEFDNEFKEYLTSINIPDSIEIESFEIVDSEGKKNFLSYLFMCEKLKEKYESRNIPEKILIDTLKDIVIWTKTWSGLKNELFLSECLWLKNHLSMKLFKLGRLQFCMNKAEYDVPSENLSTKDNVLEIHIPEDGPLTISECEESIAKAKEFFKKYYPEFKYKCFTCHSWLLDETLKDFLKPESNIIKFQNMFKIVKYEEADNILKYLFTWDTTRANIKEKEVTSSLSEKVKEHALTGGKFYENVGILK